MSRLYRTIVADPPWRYINSATKADATMHYSCMTLGQLVLLPVLDLADDDCHLWMWTTNAFMEDAHRLTRAWGFKVITIVTWCKPGPGVGHYLRNNTEHCILASRGRPTPPEKKPLATWFQWPRGRHSEKPEAFFDLVEQVSTGPYLELFSRCVRMGWDQWGDEALDPIEMPEVAA